ncbi:MAG: diaminopimelate epimerase [Deltaproteobacteria bacterium]|nr:diaminopimelate epimerase [Deltaproteobacteria bacterium]
MIEFWKMSGSGNDFILIDNRQGRVPEDEMGSFTRKVCRRRESVGADGTIFVSESQNYDFRWHYLNADGGEAEMCGNGARCVARFAFMKGIAGQKMTFQTLAGPVSAEVAGRMVKVLTPSPSGLETDIDIQHKPGWNDPSFSPAGTNADFINIVSSDLIEMRTYERGVEDETLACGTGAIASAVVASARDMVHSPVRVKTRGGEELKIYFKKKGMLFEEVWLEGTTSLIYEGRLNEEAL